MVPRVPVRLAAVQLQAWVGRTETRQDQVRPQAMAALAATLDRDSAEPAIGAGLPPLWHWLYFTPLTRASETGPDGHALRGGFLPPVPLPRRMWAGGRLRFHQPLRVGDAITRVSRIGDVQVKQGRAGALVFVTVGHAISGPSGLAVSEEHDIVYRELPAPDAPQPVPQPAPVDEGFSRRIVPDPVLLFRYSALTLNGHRIHYDRPYATQVEGYPGLVVHGPLIATLLLDLLWRERPQAQVRAFSFRAVGPVFDIHGFTACGREQTGADGVRAVALWARDHQGLLAMQAEATLA
ncbi:MAG: MaoC family dehydratase N-terminal domain-containing protein [Ramlibacter sp.]